MSCSQTASRTAPLAQRRRFATAGDEVRLRRAAFAEIARTVALWFARARQRRDLADLDAHLLKDIGVTRRQAAREAAKPFWVE
jgi:uncharacterized protein YjiS (DUF1127 family)